MRTWAWCVIAAVTVAALTAETEPPCRESETQTTPQRHDEPGDSFVYDTAARFNERVVANIDAIDTSLIAVMAGDVAVLVFVIDKLAQLHPLGEWWAVAFLAASILVCAYGYVAGFPRTNDGDGLRPRRLVPDLLAKPEEAISGAIADMVHASDVNRGVRFLKRVAVVAAIMLLFAGAMIVALARFNGDVIQ